MISVVYIKSIYAFEDFFEKRVKGNYYTRHMLGMLGVGIIMYVLMASQGHYYIEGVGYATIQDVLAGTLSAFWLLILLFAMKLLVTSLTLGSGASGGVFSPSLYMGATLGAVYGVALNWCFPGMDKVPDFAIAGMAGMVGGATGAAVTAIVMIFEMTGDYGIIIPITITVAISYGVRMMLCPESIYTLKLTRRGHHIPSALHANLSHVKHVKDIMRSSITALPASSTLDAFARTVLEHPKQSHFLVHDADRIVGLIGREAALETLDHPHSAKTLAQIANTRFIVVAGDATLADLLGEMYAKGVSISLVAANATAPSVTDIQGVVTEYETAEAMIRSVDLFCD
jgi:CIC family chloride channel protein